MALFSVAVISRGLTALLGLFVASLAYRGYRRNGSAKMRALAVGIGLLTAGVFTAVAIADVAGAGDGIVLLARGVVTVAGLSVVLYALVAE
ncbi:hypothetical protein KTS45_13315 [Halomicroarcula limicola]|uniref:YapH protein n=2 Tax=Haloarcula limicola TaxID=1429915 RepID=A0A8J7YES6_9EURY|nr:hypothetical protein [Halomicroarcula limicola]